LGWRVMETASSAEEREEFMEAAEALASSREARVEADQFLKHTGWPHHKFVRVAGDLEQDGRIRGVRTSSSDVQSTGKPSMSWMRFWIN
jgi:hypothetical protein